MTAPRTALASLAAALAAVPAQAYDPRYTWTTLETPHFRIHFHDGLYALGQKTARIAEAAHAALAPLMGHEPAERTDVVLSDDTDFSNGSATALPYNVVRLYAVPPPSRDELHSYDDYLWMLFIHEYTHILHLDRASGGPLVLRRIFGKNPLLPVAPNYAVPNWITEGVAVFQESNLTPKGRGHSRLADMAIRAQALDGGLVALDRLTNRPLQWPGDAMQWTWGGRLVEHWAAEAGEGVVDAFSGEYSSRIVPGAINLSARRTSGEDLVELHRSYAEEALREARAFAEKVRAEGETPLAPLTARGDFLHDPAWSRDGRVLYYLHRSRDRRPELRALRMTGDAPGDPAAAQGDTAVYAPALSDPSGLAVLPDGRIVVSMGEVFEEYQFYEDLWEVEGGKARRLTTGARVSQPSAAPDGSVFVVRRIEGGGTELARLAPGGALASAYRPDGPGPVDSPAVSPDGARVAFVEHRTHGWDLRVLDLAAGRARDVTPNWGGRAEEVDPAWSPDGRYLLFSSDRGGAFDLYAWDSTNGETRRVTRVVTGAFEPAVSPDGATLALVTYSARGYDLARMPFDPASWTEAEGPGSPVASADAHQAPDFSRGVPYPGRGYDPLPHLLPRFWMPLFSSDGAGTTVGVASAGFDPVGLYSWAADAWWSLAGGEPGFDAAVSADVLYRASLSVGASLALDVPPGAPVGYLERAARSFLSVDIPFTTAENAQFLTLTYELSLLQPTREPPPPDPAGPPLAVPDAGRVAALQLSWQFSDVRRFVRSISAEEGRRLRVAMRLGVPELGGQFRFVEALGSATQYLRVPFTDHHALALRAAGGVGWGDLGGRRSFSLGGIGPFNARDLLLGAQASPSSLRGYPRGAASGQAFALAQAEYRVPLWDVEQGPWTLPLYLRRVHGALFADAGDAFLLGAAPAWKLGVGAELRLEAMIGWRLGLDIRLGYARGLTEGGIDDFYLAVGGLF